MNLIVGSGPTGIACAKALLAAGQDVTLIDAGVTLDESARALLNAIRSGEASHAWEELARLSDRASMPAKGLPKKCTYGSDYAYRDAKELFRIQASETGVLPSAAVGGLSTVWGAAALPYTGHDLSDWPLSQTDLAPYYQAVLQYTGLSGKDDDLNALFPLFTGAAQPLHPCSQTRDFSSLLDSIKVKLRDKGVTHGTSRLMVKPACIYCGRCMHGCPHEYVYNSAADLAGLTARSENFRYQTNFVVDSVSETSSGVQITGFDRLERHLLTKDGERLFLAAGVLPTTKLALKMLHHYDKSVVLKDSQYFLFPILSLRGIDDAKEARNTLAQLFMEIDDPKISARLVHLQVYSHNDMVTQALERKLWFLPGLRKSLADSLSCHLLIVQGYLHSNDSGHLKLTLHQDKARQDSLRVEAVKNQETRKKCGQVISKLWELLSSHGYYPLQAGLEVCDPGRGFHCGGTFPMQPNPIGLQTDLQGRLPGLSRVHLADASTFPSVPATTITLTAMANAYRIASFAAL